jgi:beta-N-acetylhexosaminidase
MRSAVIYGCQGLTLTEQEREFFAAARPVGFILFKRNIQSADQVIELVREMYEIAGQDIVILADQEGGRVARFRPPLFRELPAAKFFADHYDQDPSGTIDLLTRHARLMGHDLRALGVTVNCAPVVDISFPETHAVIGDRAFGTTPEQVAALAMAMVIGLLEGGVTPIIKHIPGHGRATADSHLVLPIVHTSLGDLELSDFKAFRLLLEQIHQRDLDSHVWAMTAHVVYAALDPENPATLSKSVIDYIRHEIGFKGILVTDALEMEALSGTMTERTQRSFAAGADIVLHCNGKLDEMQAVQEAAIRISTETAVQLAHQQAQPSTCYTDYSKDLELVTQFLATGATPVVGFDHTEARFV